jgi:hypothetical protein
MCVASFIVDTFGANELFANRTRTHGHRDASSINHQSIPSLSGFLFFPIICCYFGQHFSYFTHQLFLFHQRMYSSDSERVSAVPLRCVVQHYAWGKSSDDPANLVAKMHESQRSFFSKGALNELGFEVTSKIIFSSSLSYPRLGFFFLHVGVGVRGVRA